MGLGGARVKEECGMMPWVLVWVTGGLLESLTAVDGGTGLTEAGMDEDFSVSYVEWEVPVGHL